MFWVSLVSLARPLGRLLTLEGVFPMILFLGIGRERPEVLDGDSDGHATPFPARGRGLIGVEGGKWKDRIFESLGDGTLGSKLISKRGFSSGTPDLPRIPDPYQPSRTVGTDEGRDLPRASVRCWSGLENRERREGKEG